MKKKKKDEIFSNNKKTYHCPFFINLPTTKMRKSISMYICRQKKEKRDSVVEGDFNSRAFVLFPFFFSSIYIYIYIYKCMCLHKGERTSIEIFITSRSFLFSLLFTLCTFVERTRDIRCSSSSKVRFSRFIPVCSLIYMCVFLLLFSSPPLPFSLLNICTPFSLVSISFNIERTLKWAKEHKTNFRMLIMLVVEWTIGFTILFTISRFIILFLSRRALRIWIHANIILLLAQRKYSRRKRTTTNIVWFVRVK